MSNKCINYIFCNGMAYPELEENTCLMCSTWYSHGEGFGKLEFIETEEDCPICYKKGTQMKFPTNCNHSFCIQCCRDLLYFQDDQFALCPVEYGCPPCSHYTSFLCDNSCKNRPCSKEDDLILEQWEKDDYESFIQWNFDELNYLNSEHKYFATKKCPMCRLEYKKIEIVIK